MRKRPLQNTWRFSGLLSFEVTKTLLKDPNIQSYLTLRCMALYLRITFFTSLFVNLFLSRSFWFCKLKFTKLFSTQLLNKIDTIWRERHSSVFWWHICLINLFSNRMLISLFNLTAKHTPKQSTTVRILSQFFCITQVAKAPVTAYDTNPESWDNLP